MSAYNMFQIPDSEDHVQPKVGSCDGTLHEIGDSVDIKNHVQLKVGICDRTLYKIGDYVNIEDGVYVASEGIIVILDETYKAYFPWLIDKWDEVIKPEVILKGRNPIEIAVKELEQKYDAEEIIRYMKNPKIKDLEFKKYMRELLNED